MKFYRFLFLIFIFIFSVDLVADDTGSVYKANILNKETNDEVRYYIKRNLKPGTKYYPNVDDEVIKKIIIGYSSTGPYAEFNLGKDGIFYEWYKDDRNGTVDMHELYKEPSHELRGAWRYDKGKLYLKYETISEELTYEIEYFNYSEYKRFATYDSYIAAIKFKNNLFKAGIVFLRSWKEPLSSEDAAIEKAKSDEIHDVVDKSFTYRCATMSANEVKKELESGADITKHDTADYTPLMRAAMNPDTEVTRILIDAGASLTDKNKLGQTPLIIAAWHCKNPEVIILLLKAGADPKAKDIFGTTILNYARGNKNLVGTLAFKTLKKAIDNK